MPKKSLGQHWLFDEASLHAICDAATITNKDTVLEIGPGLGPLTVNLVARAKEVVAVEFDERLARELPARVPAANLQVVHSDILHFDLSRLPEQYKVVANVPYYITSAIVKLFLTTPYKPQHIAMLVQKEVAQRLAASPGDMSILAVSAQYFADVKLGSIITADKFQPAPKVDSQIVVLQPHLTPLFKDIDEKLFFRIVKAGFGEKRKTLRNSLSGGLHITKDAAEALLAAAHLNPADRAEKLSLTDWYNLYLAFQATAADVAQ